MLSQRSRSLSFTPDARTWFNAVLGTPVIRLALFTAGISIDSSVLPPPLHKDPADRLIIATAQFLDVPIVTGDRLILDYAKAGHIDAIVC